MAQVENNQTTGEAVAPMGAFERWLSVWVALAIIAGLVLGSVAPGVFEILAAAEIARVNLVIAVLIWAMVYPMMIGVDFGALSQIGDRPKGLILTLAVNWLIKPFTMAALGVKRISTGGSLYRATCKLVMDAAAEMACDGSFGYLANVIPDGDVQRIVTG